jgi:hypothetical protein
MANNLDVGCECDCGCIGKEPKKEKVTRVYFCPKCKSEQVGYVFRFGNAFGVIPRMECKKCKYSAMIFPQWVVGEKKLKQLNAKAMKKRNKK